MANFEKLLLDVGPKGLALIAGTAAAGFGLKESLFSGIFQIVFSIVIAAKIIKWKDLSNS